MPTTGTEWKCLQPEKLAIDPNATSAENDWKFWYKTFSNIVAAMQQGDGAIDKLSGLTAHLTAPIYKLVSEETTYDAAITTMKNLFVKPKNEIYARHMLASAQQNVNESIDEFVLRINKLSQECDFTGVNAQQYRDDMKRDSFINGVSSNFIRQRLFENRTLTFTEAYEKARSLELATRYSELYSSREMKQKSVCSVPHELLELAAPLDDTDAGPSRRSTCSFDLPK